MLSPTSPQRITNCPCSTLTVLRLLITSCRQEGSTLSKRGSLRMSMKARWRLPFKSGFNHPLLHHHPLLLLLLLSHPCSFVSHRLTPSVIHGCWRAAAADVLSSGLTFRVCGDDTINGMMAEDG
eukprot:756730-Hanusia_phi.AAC.4